MVMEKWEVIANGDTELGTLVPLTLHSPRSHNTN
jgi:hypothetical protein